MKYKNLHAFTRPKTVTTTLPHIAHTSPFSHDFKQHNHYSHNFEHPYLNIKVKKTHFIPTLYQQTYQPVVQWEQGHTKGGKS